MRSSLLLMAAICLATLLPGQSPGSILTFDISNPQYAGSENFPEGFAIDQTYGDRISNTTVNSGANVFGYGVGAEGFTPNVEVAYGPSSIFTGGPSLWRYDYGDLVRILFQASTFTGIGNDYDYLEINLIADPGFQVALYGFDLGGWFQTDYVINGVAVYDDFFNGFFPAANREYFDPHATIKGAGPDRSQYTFGTPIRGQVVTILIDANNLGAASQFISIDNIRFGQELAPAALVPEPASLAIWGLGAMGCAVGAYRHRKRA